MCNPILISTNPNIYLIPDNIQELEDSDDDDDVIIIYDNIIQCIKEVEHYLFNDILISNIFIYINIENKDCEDIYNLLISIYDKINFIIE